jgi:hypothetical protein
MIRKLASGKYRLYSRKKNPKTGRRRNLGTFASRAAAQKHERAVQFFKRGLIGLCRRRFSSDARVKSGPPERPVGVRVACPINA